jgi:hypothetical protein
MKSLKDVNSANAALTLRNTLWALPYLGVLGLTVGYSTGGLMGAFIGLMAAAAVSTIIGSATTIFTGIVSGGAVNVFYGMGRKTIHLRERLAGDLKDPGFTEALFLKAQILWQGFEDHEAAKQCLLKIIMTEPDKKAVFHRWALNLYGEIQKNVFIRGRAVVSG